MNLIKKLNYIQLQLNNIHYLVPNNYTILQVSEFLGLIIPRFCYNKELLISGNCRMCLVEVKNNIKPVSSCSLNIIPNMVIYTETSLVKKARENVLEFLLLNHPLDCPICDQGGECDLQNQSLLYGSNKSRFYNLKRSVENKNIGPLIKTIMTRCIHCTKCVRFLEEISGLPVLGTTRRGSLTEITSYINLNIKSELSGNLIDLCPVGALTSKPYAFTTRVWELKTKPGIDLFDGLGSNILVNLKGTSIMRIIPSINTQINKEWISDKVRFSFDGFNIQRLNTFFFKVNNNQNLIQTWKNAFIEVNNQIFLNNIFLQKKGYKYILGITGKFISLETLYIFKKILNTHGITNIISETTKFTHNLDFSKNFIFKHTLTNFNSSNFCLLVGSNIKHEAPILNSQLRQRILKGNFNIYSLGSNSLKNMFIENVGFSIKELILLTEGRHKLSKLLVKAKNPIFILSSNIFNNKNKKLIYFLFSIIEFQLLKMYKQWNNLNILHSYANDVGCLELGFKKILRTNMFNIIFLLGTDNYSFKLLKKKSLLIYIGSSGTQNATESSIILPSYSFIEETGIYMNTEGRAQTFEFLKRYELKNKSVWSIIQKMFINSNTFLSVYFFKETMKEIQSDLINNTPLFLNKKKFSLDFYSKKIPFIIKNLNFNKPFNEFIENYYLNDPISKNSSIMGKTSFYLRYNQNFKQKYAYNNN